MVDELRKDYEQYDSLPVSGTPELTSVGRRAMQGGPRETTPTPDGWEDRGIQSVKVADLPTPENIDPGKFKKVSLPEMQQGLLRLQEMQPMLDQGVSPDYWNEIDRQQGLQYRDGYRQVYDAFYGSGKIKLDKIGDQYDINNGRHRIWLAKQMGLETLPAHVIERRDGGQ